MKFRDIFFVLPFGCIPFGCVAQFLPDLPERLVASSIISPASAEQLSLEMPSLHSEIQVLEFIKTARTSPPTDDVARDSWAIIARNLVDCGLISPKVARNLVQLSEENLIGTEENFYKIAQKQVLYNEWQQPERLLLFLERLSALNLIDDVGFQQIEASIQTKQLATPYDFLAYTPQAAIISGNTTTIDEEFKTNELLLKISRVLPSNITLSEISSQVVLAESASESTEFSVYITANGKKYAQLCRHATDLHKVFNKILVNEASDYRLHYIPFYELTTDIRLDSTRFGVVLLDKYQESMLLEPLELSDGMFAQILGLKGFWELTPENYDTALSTAQIDSLIARYQAANLFSHLAPEELETYVARVKEQTIQSPLDILACFPNTIFQTNPELPAGKDPYKRLLTRLKLAAHGDFQPTNITEQIHKATQQSALTFSLNGKVYRPQFSIEENYIDGKFWEMVQKWTSPTAKFHLLKTQNTQTALIWLTEEQYEAIKETDLLLFEE